MYESAACKCNELIFFYSNEKTRKRYIYFFINDSISVHPNPGCDFIILYPPQAKGFHADLYFVAFDEVDFVQLNLVLIS